MWLIYPLTEEDGYDIPMWQYLVHIFIEDFYEPRHLIVNYSLFEN